MTSTQQKVSFLLLILLSFICGSNGSYDCVNHCACDKRDGVISADCRGMNFTEVPQPDPKYPVNILYLQYNRITRLRAGEFGLYHQLKELYIQGNKMDTVESGAFDGLQTLQKLDISGNKLNNIPEINKLPDLEWLSASMNAMRKIPAGIASLTKLKELDLSTNSFISDIQQGSLPASLAKLNMQNTAVRNFKKSSFDSLTNLKELILSDNRAASLVQFENHAFDGLVSLEYLDLSRTYCKKLPTDSFVALGNLTTLLLNNCWLTNMPIFAKTQNRTKRDVIGTSTGAIPKTTATTAAPKRTTEAPHASTIPMTTASASTAPPPGDIWYNPKLETLDLSNNRNLNISAHPVRFPETLLDLRLGSTLIPTIDGNMFNETIQVQKLDLCNSKIKSISRDAFMRFRNVSEICLSGNPLTGAPRLPRSLLNLNLSETKITNLTRIILDGLSHVVEANIRSGKIEWIGDDAFGSMTSLRVLDLSDNQIDTITAKSLRTGEFDYSFAENRLLRLRLRSRRSTEVGDGRRSSLLKLNLSGNILRVIERGAFATHANLLHMDLQGNFLQSLQPGDFAGLRSLTMLDISKNSLTTIVPDAFAEMTRLEVLDLSQNALEDILEGTFGGLAALKRLDLGRNGIMIFHPFASETLEYLDISNNNLTAFPELKGSSLREIIASGNNFKVFTPGCLGGMPNLENLDMSKCGITHINYGIFQGTHGLRVLDLSGNHIVNFLDQTLPSLEVLSLEENDIQTIQANLDSVAPRILRLELHYNNISYLDPQVFSDSTMVELDITGNSLQCTCELLPLVEWIEKNLNSGAVNVVDAELYTCEGPPDLYATPVLVAVSELNCEKKPEPKRAGMYAGIAVAMGLFLLVFLLLVWVFLVSPRTRRRQNENGGPTINENGGQEVIMAPKGCCIPCKQWWLGMNYRNDRGRRGRIVSDERRDLVVASPVTSPVDTEPPTSL